MSGGTQVLPVFSTVAGLVRELGPCQPWVRVHQDGPANVARGSACATSSSTRPSRQVPGAGTPNGWPGSAPGHTSARRSDLRFQAVRDDLRRAAGTFEQMVTLWTVMSPDGPEGTGGGSPRFDEALAQLLGAIGERHLRPGGGHRRART